MSLTVGQRVELTGKGVRGSVAFIGLTSFATGKWIGVVLDEPKGKNNGTVQGKTYFSCGENEGVFVRQGQLTMLDEAGNAIESVASTPDASEPKRSRLPGGTRRKTEPTTVRRKSSPAQAGKPRTERPSTRTTLAMSRSQSEFSTPGSAATTPRSSFVETGFVETLKPQFTPGAAIASPAVGQSVEERVTALQAAQASAQADESLRAQLTDALEKLETLRAKRLQDKEKMLELEKCRVQVEQLLEFKSRILESQASLQRDLQRARQETRDAVEARELHAEEMSDLAETMEMATLDKEMAEEKSETLALELETAKERVEELTLDLEILRAERTGGEGGAGVSSYEITQLEQQNARLRETLVRMRDLSAHEKHEQHKLAKEADQTRSEVQELSRTKQKLSARVEELENIVADLQEQVDAALGAEEMVRVLGDAKLSLEERVAELEDAVADLEDLQDMNEQVQEGSHELESELREELDLANAAVRKVQREREAALETIADRDQIIGKFRELVQELQQQNVALQQAQAENSQRPLALEQLDFGKVFAESRAHTRAVDLELRQLEAAQLRKQVALLSGFLPDHLTARGGDQDAIQTMLLLERLALKADILLAQTRDRFPPPPPLDRFNVVKGTEAGRYAFGSRMSLLLHSLQVPVHQMLRALDVCSPDALLRVAATLQELSVHEKTLDAFVELVKRDQLDENVRLEPLSRCGAVLSAMLSALVGDLAAHDGALVSDVSAAVIAASASFATDARVVQLLLQDQSGPAHQMTSQLLAAAETLQKQLKTARRLVGRDVASAGISKDAAVQIAQCCQVAAQLAAFAQAWSKAALALLAGDAERGLPGDKLLELAALSSDSEPPAQLVSSGVASLLSEVASLTQTLQEAEEHALLQKPPPTPVPPMTLRAQTVKKELEETRNLRSKLENKEADLKELRLAAKLKAEELSEMSLRRELAEKRLATSGRESEMALEKANRKLTDALELLKRKEREFEETLDHLQMDIDSLESERGELKDKLKLTARKAEGLNRGSVGPVELAAPAAVGPTVPLSTEGRVRGLEAALRLALRERTRLRTDAAKQRLARLKPLHVPRKPLQADAVLDELSRRAASVQQEMLQVLACPKVVDISKRVPGSVAWLDRTAPALHVTREALKVKQVAEKVEALQAEIAREAAKRRPGGSVDASFAMFPSVEMCRRLNEQSSQPIGQLEIVGLGQSQGCVPITLDSDALRTLHSRLIF